MRPAPGVAFGDRYELSDRIAVGGMGAFFLGSVHHTLGRLALAAADRPAAGRHLRAALDIHRRLGFRPLAASTAAILGEAELP